MIVLYKGRRGAGKTLTMTKDAYNYYCMGWTVYSNIEFNFPHEYISEDDILNIDGDSPIANCVLVIDEIQILLDSRRSARNRNVDFSYFIQQIRKRGIILLCTTQFTGTVDLRLRQHVDVLVKPKFHKRLQVCEVYYMDLTAIEEIDFMMYDPAEVAAMRSVVYDARSVYGLYDTNRIVKVSDEKKERKKKEI